MGMVALRPFSESGYEIFDDEIDRGRVTIWSRAPVLPRIGDVLLIESDGYLYDVEIVQLSPLPGGWAATADVVGIY